MVLVPKNELIYIAVTREAQESQSFEISQCCAIFESTMIQKKVLTLTTNTTSWPRRKGKFSLTSNKGLNPASYLFVKVDKIQRNYFEIPVDTKCESDA